MRRSRSDIKSSVVAVYELSVHCLQLSHKFNAFSQRYLVLATGHCSKSYTAAGQ
jgi:hypothetical protein